MTKLPAGRGTIAAPSIGFTARKPQDSLVNEI